MNTDDPDVHLRIAEAHKAKVLNLLRENPDGLTDFEIAARLDMHLSSVNATRNGLMNKGLVDKTEQKRPSGRGGMATVWIPAKVSQQ